MTNIINVEASQIESKDIAGAVVLYNSSDDVLVNIETYIDQVATLYVIDNSTCPNDKLIEHLRSNKKIQYFSLNGNLGIATALNFAAQRAISDKFTLLLTMDDDTRTPANMVWQMINFWNHYPNQIGILSGIHHTRHDTALSRTLLYTLTSGNLLNLAAYQAIGPFRDDFFIDHVDHEYGLRLNQSGYAVIELPSIRLEHRLGYTQRLTIGPYTIGTYGSHSPIRLYYFARNGVYIARQHFYNHPFFAWTVLEELGKRWIKALFLQDNRKERIKMLIKGVKHGWIGQLGQYSK
jgi:rhamnosyltransferase